jgi:hypothetical protein
LQDELSIPEAAVLIVRDVHQTTDIDYYEAIKNVQTALIRAIDRNELEHRQDNMTVKDVNGYEYIDKIYQYVNVNSLKSWLSSKGFRPSFFFPDAVEGPEYLNPAHPRYSKKLAAAVEAWLNVSEVSRTSPKQALMQWLRENAARFGLADSNGVPSETRIEPIATLVNWRPEGGAPPTQSKTTTS